MYLFIGSPSMVQRYTIQIISQVFTRLKSWFSVSQKILEHNKEMLRIMIEKMNELILENNKLREEIAEKEKLQKEELLQICMKTTWEE